MNNIYIYMKYIIKYSQTGGDMELNDIIDLTNLKPNKTLEEKKDGLEILTSKKKKINFSPMFENPLNAKKKSPTKSIHLVVPGLMPVLPETWKEYDEKKIFYMPNDFIPHFHGSASHHEGNGFQLDRAFILSKKDFIETSKKLKTFRDKLEGFNNGEPETPIETWIHWKIPDNKIQYKDLKIRENSILWWDFDNNHNLFCCSEKSFNNGDSGTPIETWIHWKIPDNEKQYKDLKIRKNSILWWDFEDWHNLYYCSKESFDKNKVNKKDTENIKIEDNLNKGKGKNIVVTIMDQIGDYYFICSVGNHAEKGHKIKITVVE